jgi:hypothetical protein
MKQTRLLVIIILLGLLLLTAQRVALAFPFSAEQYRTVDPSLNGRSLSINGSKSGSGDFDGGYGAVIKAEIDPAIGAPNWQGTGAVTVDIDDVSCSIKVKVLYISLSTGLAYWQDLADDSGSTYQKDPARITGYTPTRTVDYSKSFSWPLPSSGDYPYKVRVEFNLSFKGSVVPGLQSGSATAGGGGYINAWRDTGSGGSGSIKPLSQLNVGSTPISVTISYSGTVSGSASTSFTLYGVDEDLSVTLTAPSSVTSGGVTYKFVKWSTSDGDFNSTSITISVSKGSSKSATAVYQSQGGGGNPPQPPSPSPPQPPSPSPPSPPPPPNYTLTLQLYRVDQNGNSLGPASGVQVSLNGANYTTDSNGKVSLSVKSGSTVSVQVYQTYFNNNWGRYTFWKWSDGNTQNPRSFTVSSDTTVTAYVYDERLIKVTWSQDAAGHVNVNGQPVSNGWTSWYRYGTQLTLQAVPTSGIFKKWQRGINGGSLADYSTASTITVSVDNGYQFKALFDLIVTIQLGTMYLPGEGVITPWLEDISNWAWNGTWFFNVTELYRVNEHLVALLTDGSNVKAIDLTNGTRINIYLPSGWKNNPFVKAVGLVKITQIPNDKNTLANTFPAINFSGQTWYLVALAAWNPYKQFSGGYDTSCWLANGTTLAVYNLTYTFTFADGTRAIFKEPVVVSALKTAVAPIYTNGNMKQALALKVTTAWKYLPPARTGIQPQPPSSVTGVVTIGNTVYNGTLIGSNSTSKTFLVTITNDTWTLYSKGVNSITASAYWLSSMGTPEGPVAQQDPTQLSVVYAMPYIESISEGTSLTATVSILDAKSSQTYSGNIYVELRDPNTMNLVASYGPYYAPGSGTITSTLPW